MCRAPSPNRRAVVERLDRGQHPVEVEQRLAHPHEHDVGQPLAVPRASRRDASRTWSTISATSRSRPNPSSPVAQNGQPTAQPAWLEMHSVCRSRDAGTRRVVHQHRLDQRAVVEPVEGLLGQAAVGPVHLGVGDRVEPEGGLELGAEGGRQRRDLIDRADCAAPHGVADLSRAVARDAPLRQPRGELVGWQSRQTGAHVRAHGPAPAHRCR